ncbi:MAG: carboxy terminal-processing peptidase [Pseudomonadales bacterium]|nr:carboxy terminal-processing peptidase [Pseudomonadales bacterium]
MNKFQQCTILITLVCSGFASGIHANKNSTHLTISDYYQEFAPEPLYRETAVDILDKLRERHYRRVPIDNKLSSSVYNNYLKLLDPSHLHFLAADIEQFERYRYQLDDNLKKGDLDAAYEIFNRYQQRRIERLIFVINYLENRYDTVQFDTDEFFNIDRKNAVWPATLEEMDEIWRKRVKNNILSQKLSDSETDDIQQKLIKRYRSRLNRLSKTRSQDIFQNYMMALSQSYGPHTQYFSPRLSENFDINMSLSLEGIGAVLTMENEHTKVIRLVSEGPADKAGQLKATDHIIAVGQGKTGELIDVVGWRLDDVVDLIRGKKNTTVRLTIIPGGSESKPSRTIQIVRNQVKLEDQSAKADLLELEHNGQKRKVGIISLPTFYLDFKAYREGNPNYKSTTSDVRKLIQELKKDNIDGLVIDLRNNGGGSLQEVNSLVGLFIKQGPTVQIRNTSGRIDVLGDSDSGVLYDGPLVVMVNRLSASASEIFAGAIQDYNRGIIVGGQTFGKGTVQSILPVEQGQIKLTLAKFYRVSGNSTQNRGVLPDIYFPESMDIEKIGESSLPEALPWDQIRSASYNSLAEIEPLIPKLTELHQQRAKQDPEFHYLVERIAHLQEQQKITELPLNVSVRKAEINKNEKWALDLENTLRKSQGDKPYADYAELKAASELELSEKTKNDKDAEPDTLQREGAKILLDYIQYSTQSLVTH